MRFSCSKERVSWIFELARVWIKSDLCTDVTVTCLSSQDVDRKVDFKCHKLMLLPLLSHNCPIHCVNFEDIDSIILPDISPEFFTQYLNYVYGLEQTSLDFSQILHPSVGVESLLANGFTSVKVKVEHDDYYDDDDYVDNCDRGNNGVGVEDRKNMTLEVNHKSIEIKLQKRSREDSDDEDQDYKPQIKKANTSTSKPRPIQDITCFSQDCDLKFTRTDKYKKHFLQCHPHEEYIAPTKRDPKLPTCRKCDLTFPDLRSVKRHRKKVHEKRAGRVFACDVCDQKYKKRESLTKHINTHHIVIRCTCFKVFNSELEFYEHKQEHTEDPDNHQLVREKVEGKMTAGVKSETIPMKKSEPKEVKAAKKEAGSVITKEKTWHPCTHCHEAFSSLKERCKHMLDEHYNELKEADRIYTKDKRLQIKWISCDYDNCDVWLRTNTDKINHIAISHTKEKNHICEVCCQGFNNKAKLKNHIDLKHSTADEQRMCNECGECFGNNTKLRYHQACAHKPKIRQFKCKYCDYDTYHKPQLVEHERTHTGEKPEICQWCGQGFSSKRTRENHERLHTGEKPYKCNFCDNCFAQRTGLNVHIQTHHKEVANDPNIKKYNYTKKPGRAAAVPKLEPKTAPPPSAAAAAPHTSNSYHDQMEQLQRYQLEAAAAAASIRAYHDPYSPP